eukprot:g44694.t1
MGYPVVGVNYFGDEGAHVAKCLWHLQKELQEKKKTIDDIEKDHKNVPVRKRGEWLGIHYQTAVEELALDNKTFLPYIGVYAAKVLSKSKHPALMRPKIGMWWK